MRLERLTVRGFRGYGHEQALALSDLTTIIGRNDVGKSTLLEALEIFFNNEVVKIDGSDRHVAAESNVAEITCEFSGFPGSVVIDASAETNLAEEQLLTADGLLAIRKRYTFSGVKPKEEVFVVAQHPTREGFGDLFELTVANLKARMKELAIPTDGVNQSVKSEMRRAIWNATDAPELKTVMIPVSSGELKSVWEKLSTLLPMFALFQSDRPSKDSDSEVQDPMKLAIASAIAEPEIQAKLIEVSDAVRAKATELAARTHDALKRLDANLADELVPHFKADPKWGGVFSVGLEGANGVPINKRGSGVRRLVLVSFFRAEAERKLAEGGQQNIIYAIEEPETSQHPRNQKILLEALSALSENDGCQVILTTHSPSVASALPADSLRFVRRNLSGDPEILAVDEARRQEIADELGVNPDTRIRALICVEGPHDVAAFKCLSSALHADDSSFINLSEDSRVAFIPLGGSSLGQWVSANYLRGIGIPEVHIYDGDKPEYGVSVDAVNRRGDSSWAVQLLKLEIENYLHPAAVKGGLGVEIEIDDRSDIPTRISDHPSIQWNSKNVKKQLAGRVFPLMTNDLVAERDPQGELAGLMRRISATVEA